LLEVVKLVGDAETLETRELVISHSLVISTSLTLNPSNANYLFAAYIYVSYRCKQPDNATVMDVQKKLQENNIDINQLAEWPVDHCQQGGSSTEGGSC